MGLKDHHLKKNTNKKKNQSENITIDAKHNEMIKHFQTLQKSLPEKRKELKNLKEQFIKVSEVEHNEFDMEFILFKDSIQDKIKGVEKEIQDIIDKKEEKSYYLNVGTLLIDYYENMEHSKKKNNHSNDDFVITHQHIDDDELQDDDEYEEDEDDDDNNFFDDEDEEFMDDDDEDDEIQTTTSNSTSTSKNKNKNKKENIQQKPSKSVIDFFMIGNEAEAVDETIQQEQQEQQQQQQQIQQEETEISKDKEMNFASMKISDFVKQESKFKKRDILEEYLLLVDPSYIPSVKFDTKLCFCKSCNYEMTLYATDGIQVCEKCGLQENILIESDKPSFKDCNGEGSNGCFTYKRQNHFSEWLSQFQAKETTEIPEEVYEKILVEIKKERITNLETLTTTKIRQYLKKIKCNKYYDHAAYILYQINGVPPPTINKHLEEKLKLMFKEIQGPFNEVCSRKIRKNFLNYSYVLHKFVELLGLDDYKKYFPLLKDRQKLHETDMIWKKICEKLDWEFYKSI